MEHPDPKRFGWSDYIEETLTVENPPEVHPATVAAETIIRGKKLFLFGKTFWTYQIEVLSHREYKTS